MYLVVDDNDDSVYFEGTKEECEDFFRNPVTEEIFDVGNISAHIETVKQYNAKFE